MPHDHRHISMTITKHKIKFKVKLLQILVELYINFFLQSLPKSNIVTKTLIKLKY
jgi:hypothetical protein